MSSLQVLSASLMIHFLINGPVSSKGEPSMNIYDNFFMLLCLSSFLASSFQANTNNKHPPGAATDVHVRSFCLTDFPQLIRDFDRSGECCVFHRVWKTSENQPMNKSLGLFLSAAAFMCHLMCTAEVCPPAGFCDDNKLKGRCGYRCWGVAIEVTPVKLL